MVRFLFVCAGNVNRSPAFERYWKEKEPSTEVRSSGIYYGYPHSLNRDLLEWADFVVVMDLSQAKHIKEFYPEFYGKVEVAGVSDQYDVDDPLIKELFDLWYERREGELG